MVALRGYLHWAALRSARPLEFRTRTQHFSSETTTIRTPSHPPPCRRCGVNLFLAGKKSVRDMMYTAAIKCLFMCGCCMQAQHRCTGIFTLISRSSSHTECGEHSWSTTHAPKPKTAPTAAGRRTRVFGARAAHWRV